MLAAEQGSLEIVQELIRRGANVNLDDVVSETSALSPMRKKPLPHPPVLWLLGDRWASWLAPVSMVTLSVCILGLLVGSDFCSQGGSRGGGEGAAGEQRLHRAQGYGGSKASWEM